MSSSKLIGVLEADQHCLLGHVTAVSVLDERHLEPQKGRMAQLPSDGYEKDKQPQVWHYKVVPHGQLSGYCGLHMFTYYISIANPKSMPKGGEPGNI